MYWPVYKNLETEVTSLMYSIHVDDLQLAVYSSRISDLIIRSVVEIESISKTLYFENGGKKRKNIHFDYDALSFLDDVWKLSSKIIIINNVNCFQSEKILKPFVPDYRTSAGKLTYSWNNAYQSLKHDRINSLHMGNLKSLFNSMAALFVLNVYYKKERYDLADDANGTKFLLNLGSDIFSIKLHNEPGVSGDGTYTKKVDFIECVYLLKPTDETSKDAVRVLRKAFSGENYIKEKMNLINHVANKEINSGNKDEAKLRRVLDQKSKEFDNNLLIQEIKKNPKEIKTAFDAMRYEAVLNKNQV